MKVIFFALFFAPGILARSAVNQQEVQIVGPWCPIDDPLIREYPIPANLTLGPLLKLDLGSELDNFIAEGLSTYFYKVELDVFVLTALTEFKVEKLTANATLSANGYIDPSPLRSETFPSGNLSATNEIVKVSLTGLEFKYWAAYAISPKGKVEVTNFTLEALQFDSLSIDLGNMQIGGQTHNWTEISASIKQNFDRDLAENKPAIDDKMKVVMKGIFEDVYIADLLDPLPGQPEKPCFNKYFSY